MDELDRCRPDYAVSYLETIKHVFNVKGMIFLLAVDLHHLEASTKSLFGSDLKFPEYFRKFCHRTFHLPKPVKAPMQQLLEEYINQYVIITGKRISRFKPSNTFRQSAAELAIAFDMTPRQVQEAFRIFGHIMSTHNSNNASNLIPFWALGAIMLCYLRVANKELYHEILVESPDHRALCNELQRLLGCKKAKHWILLYLTAIDEDSISSDQLKPILEELGYLPNNSKIEDILETYHYGWNDSQAPLQTLSRRIESVENFE